MIEFKRKYSMQNGNKVTKKNWHKVVAVSLRPDFSHHGYPDTHPIGKAKLEGQYFEKWRLVYEEPKYKLDGNAGYIFREINHGGGINGRHSTFKKAIFEALGSRDIKVFIED